MLWEWEGFVLLRVDYILNLQHATCSQCWRKQRFRKKPERKVKTWQIFFHISICLMIGAPVKTWYKASCSSGWIFISKKQDTGQMLHLWNTVVLQDGKRPCKRTKWVPVIRAGLECMSHWEKESCVQYQKHWSVVWCEVQFWGSQVRQ